MNILSRRFITYLFYYYIKMKMSSQKCDLTRNKISEVPPQPQSKWSNPPPKTVPYDQYNFPNWDKNRGHFRQTGDGFGFSNFRVNCQDPNTINANLTPRIDPVTMPNNPLATIEAKRSESFLFRDKYRDYILYEEDANKSKDDQDVGYDGVINKTIESNPLMRLFFSKENVDHLLKVICRLVEEFSPKYKISPEAQNKNELLTVMRSMYFQVPTNPHGDMKEDLCRLNRGVLDWIVPRTIVNIQSYLGYVRDQSTRRVTIPRAENVSTAGTRTNILFPIR